EVLFGGAQFIFELLHERIFGFNGMLFHDEVRGAGGRDEFLKHDDEKARFFAQFGKRPHDKVDGLEIGTDFDDDILAHNFVAGGNGAMNGGAKFQAQAAAGHVDDLVARHARGGFEKSAGPTGEVNNLSLFVDDDTGRR